MLRGLKLLLLLLALPVAAVSTSLYVQSEIEAAWRGAVAAGYGAESARQVPEAKLLCATEPAYRQDFSRACADLAGTERTKRAALGAIGLGLLLVAGIMVAGQLSRRRPELIRHLFPRGLRLTMTTLILLIPAHAVLFLAALWYGQIALLGEVNLLLMLPVSMAVLLGTIAMTAVAYTAVGEVTTRVFGLPLTRKAHPELWRFVQDIARRLETRPPQHIIAGAEPHLFITDSDVVHPAGLLRGRTLYLSLPLCKELTPEELEAMIGHELGHFRGPDLSFSRHVYPLYREAKDALTTLVRSSHGLRSIALLPSLYTLDLFLGSFAAAVEGVSREREFTADQAGAEAAGRLQMAGALAKLGDLGSAALHLAGANPPLAQRLAALQSGPAATWQIMMSLPAERSALTLFRQPEALEQELSALA